MSLAQMQGDASHRIFSDLQFTIVGKIAMKLKKNIFTDLSKSSAQFPERYQTSLGERESRNYNSQKVVEAFCNNVSI